jgi:hypothetical protein
MSCPIFEDAMARFRAFLSEQGWPTELVWVRPADGGRGSPSKHSWRKCPEAYARKEYNEARAKGLGVCLDAVCIVGSTTCATILYPADERDAELLMFPSDGGLKLSVAVTKTAGHVRDFGDA